jgi:catechol 2,3-dioxygenase-like lactoylglutathione lyase family enzyme
MDIHHVCLAVMDMERSLGCYRDLLGFRVILDVELPDGPGEGTYHDQQQLDDIFHTRGTRSRMIMLRSKEGALLELQQPFNPVVQPAPADHLRYGWTGMKELAFAVSDIDEWFEKVRAAGYETQTDYVWSYGVFTKEGAPGVGRSFLFYDPDGTMLQLNEQ